MRLLNDNTMALGLLSSLFGHGAAFFRMTCPAMLVTERLDPIVSPGQTSGHVHAVLGGNAFGASMTYEDTQRSTCTSCLVDGDFSNYWVPNLYYKSQDGKNFTQVKPINDGGGNIYYFQDRATYPNKSVQAFPAGFRMTAGNPERRSYNESIAATQITHACIDYTGGPTQITQNFPKENCPQGIRSQVFFPSCWDGVNLDTDDHQSHMAYPNQGDSGVCPDSHPNPMVSIFYEFTWDTNVFANDWYDGEQPFVLSMGDQSGYGFHGDFINGWRAGLLQSAIETCTYGNDHAFDPYYCSVLKPPHVSPSDCSIPPAVNEIISGSLPALPGCNPVTLTPQLITDCNSTSGFTDMSSLYYTDLTKSKGWAYLGCGADNYFSRALTGASETMPSMTVEICVNFCGGKGFSVAGLEYGDECYCANSVPPSAAPPPYVIGNCSMPCAGDAKEICGFADALSLYQLCEGTCKNAPLGLPAASSSISAVDPTTSVGVSANSGSSITVLKGISTAEPSGTTSMAVTGTAETEFLDVTATPLTMMNSASLSTTSTSPGPSSTRASDITLLSGWASAGCFLDTLNPRSLGGIEYAWWGQSMTSSGCVNYCSEQGYTQAGTENGGQCFCGNVLVGSKQEPTTDCNMPCEGDKGQICGGPARLSIYAKSATKKKRTRKPRHASHHLAGLV